MTHAAVTSRTHRQAHARLVQKQGKKRSPGFGLERWMEVNDPALEPDWDPRRTRFAPRSPLFVPSPRLVLACTGTGAWFPTPRLRDGTGPARPGTLRQTSLPLPIGGRSALVQRGARFFFRARESRREPRGTRGRASRRRILLEDVLL